MKPLLYLELLLYLNLKVLEKNVNWIIVYDFVKAIYSLWMLWKLAFAKQAFYKKAFLRILALMITKNLKSYYEKLS